MKIKGRTVYARFLAYFFHCDKVQILFLKQRNERFVHAQSRMKVFALRLVHLLSALSVLLRVICDLFCKLYDFIAIFLLSCVKQFFV